MYSVYILKSINFYKFYTGYTDDLHHRLLQHNNGENIYSKRYKPWKIVYRENFNQQQDTIKREKYLKSAAGRRWIKNKFQGNIK